MAVTVTAPVTQTLHGPSEPESESLHGPPESVTVGVGPVTRYCEKTNNYNYRVHASDPGRRGPRLSHDRGVTELGPRARAGGCQYDPEMHDVGFVLTLIVISSCYSLVDALSSFSPSLCYNVFAVDDVRCPFLLGKGFGPMPYKYLWHEWTKLEQEITSINYIAEENIDAIISLLS
jgi:hypothetical protein